MEKELTLGLARTCQAFWGLTFPATELAVFAILAAAPVLTLKINNLWVVLWKESLGRAQS